MNLISRSDYLNEMAQDRANARTNADVARRMRQTINSAMADLRLELLSQVNGLSLDAIDEVESQIISWFGPQGAYRDAVSDITHSILPDEPAAEGDALQVAAE